MIKDIIDKNENVKPNTSKIIKLKELIPNCFDRKGNLDIDLLKKEFNQDLNFTKESFELNFLGKSYAKMITGLDTETVIEPDIAHNNEQVNKNSENIYISGDNLDSLKHLLKAYEGKIKCIYIDPPYNTGSDGFVYNDTFGFTKENLIEKLDVSEEEADRIISMTSGKSSSHSAWLTFMYPRLYLARELMTEDGIIAISIDDNEYADLRILCDDVFGAENFIANVCQKSRASISNDKIISSNHNYLLLFAKNILNLEKQKKRIGINPSLDGFNYSDENGEYKLVPVDGPGGELKGNPYYEFLGIIGYWRFSKDKMQEMYENGLIVKKENSLQQKYYLNKAKESRKTISTWWDDDMLTSSATSYLNNLMGGKVFNNPKNLNLLNRIFEMFLHDDKTAIVLDFFGGSSSTAEALMNYNAADNGFRKYILIQLKEETNPDVKKLGYKTIDEIGQERIKKAAEKLKKETDANIDYGFKHYTLKNTDNNLLNKLEQFEPQLINETYDLYKEYGIDTIVETWKLRDGYEFTTPVKVINCAGYKVYKCEDSLYLIEPNINIDNIKALLEYYSSDDLFVCNKIVLFGYSFKFNELEMIKNNIKQVKNFKNIDVKVYTRY